MTTVRHSVFVGASAEEVWAVISDVRNLPHWNQHIRGVRGVPNRELRVGDRYWADIRIVGVSFAIRASVLEIEPPRRSIIKLSGPLDAVVRTWVRPAGKERSRLEHEVEYTLRGGPVGALIAKAVSYVGAPTILKRGTLAQKREVEAG
jgi:uncharacterized membrane protein